MTASGTAVSPVADGAARWAESVFEKEGIRLTMGGEPTYLPEHPDGAEWSYAAVGPTKLRYARRMADDLLRSRMAGGAVFFSPGKQYPGETNPRWALRLIARRDGAPIFAAAPTGRPTEEGAARDFLASLPARIGVEAGWLTFSDPRNESAPAWVLPLDHDESAHSGWTSIAWDLDVKERRLLAAEGPAGLRLPLQLLDAETPRRALVVQLLEGRLAIFVPPLLQDPFTELLDALGRSIAAGGVGLYELQGYVPEDTARIWTALGLTADPGVLEVNLPACAGWREYDAWIHEVTASAKRVGLRAWKKTDGDYPGGTGGGNHLLMGGPTIDENPFLARPAWVASMLRHLQRHPALAYLFTGSYVGASSQAPRPDESAKDLFDLEMAYRFLETLPGGDQRTLLNETLRHLHTDVTGNNHRSETSFDKFWNPGSPGGCLGLIEFRAIETLPSAEWMSAIALLWYCVAALALVRPAAAPLRDFGRQLHDRCFLPTPLLADLETLLDELDEAGCAFPRDVLKSIWDWRFPALLRHGEGASGLEVRRAHESWPLLCETPVDGGTTSRFVDTSMHRLEVRAGEAFAASCEVLVQGRGLPLRPTESGIHLAGLRYRRSNLYPCLHPGIPVHLPLELTVVQRQGGAVLAAYRMDSRATAFAAVEQPAPPRPKEPCRPIFEGALTCDLRLD